jgi:nucleotide-binding universal stress UspA family protein
MEIFNSILVISHSTEHCIGVLQKGISLAKKYDAKLGVLHIMHDPFSLEGWNLPVPSLEEEYKKMVAKAKKDLNEMIAAEKAEGLRITEWIKDGEPVEEIQKVVKSESVDLVIMLAHTEGRLEHFLFGKSNEAVIRRLPATLMLVKCG